MTGELAIQIRDLKKNYGDVEVLKGVDLNVERGTMLALLGPNGAGKTTVVKILSTLAGPSSGSVTVNGYDVVRQRDGVRRSIGLVSQFVALDWMHTGRENLIMLGRLHHLSVANAKVRAQQLLEQFDLVEAGDKQVKGYSGGMKRRLDLAASLLVTPPILYLDEPTTGLDPRSRATMWAAIKQLLAAGTTILLTTQYLEEADQLADKIAVIDGGRIIAEGTAAELKQGVGKERVELVLASGGDFNRARQVIEGDGLQHDEDTRTISLVVDGAAHVKRLLDTLENKGLEIESLSLTKPTLDDVFFALTRRGNEPTNQSTDDNHDEEVGAAL
ncbi:ATP-binding cassette domain-containing protein [Actinophytocola gossypii]|uniref:ATP-binding cassette domain-containing protein n=1 Tax=Actinophytocola gossypii TaxID=2812003 RepID=A0ABT2JBC0_9PSEU|nr:ATP-binding cassette domain-containing protein [Actinophytocola gossypii]MCT2585140.1 ATP-binding cassette domain-containing protein [Actinophytocola gossypii]